MHDQPVTDQVVGRYTEFALTSHMGTHVDTPLHVFPNGASLDDYAPDRFCGTAVVFAVQREGATAITAEDLRAVDPGLRPGEMAFLSFGYASKFGTPSYLEHPHLTVDAAKYLVDRGASLVGMDVVTPDVPRVLRPEGFDFPVHVELLGNDVLILENLAPPLDAFEGQRVEVSMAPLPIAGGDGAPLVPLVRTSRTSTHV
jgi:arylformamidase